MNFKMCCLVTFAGSLLFGNSGLCEIDKNGSRIVGKLMQTMSRLQKE
jgi:hypothetical protein